MPAQLEVLAGPKHGVEALPLHVARSGLTSFTLDRPKVRVGLYRTVLTEGQQSDLVAFLDHELLIEKWPVLRTLINRHIHDVAVPVLRGLPAGLAVPQHGGTVDQQETTTRGTRHRIAAAVMAEYDHRRRLHPALEVHAAEPGAAA
ncbi:hypothetical protein ACW4TU_04325 [Streptomyces sp. QTS52]